MKEQLHYLVREPKEIKDKNPAILLLHGYGSNEEDLFSFANELSDEYYIFSVRAPQGLDQFGYAWFPITFDVMGNKSINPTEVFEAKDLVLNFIDEIITKYPINESNFNLVGFSQGAILSYLLAFSSPKTFNKIVALSGYFRDDFVPPLHDKNDYKHLRFFVSHGTSDQVISFEDGKKATKKLEALDIPFTFCKYPVGHGVAPQNFFDFKKFLED